MLVKTVTKKNIFTQVSSTSGGFAPQNPTRRFAAGGVLEREAPRNMRNSAVITVIFLSSRLEAAVGKPTNQHPVAVSALTLLVVRQEEHPACEK